MAKELVRFRADPELVRVAVRRCSGMGPWGVYVSVSRVGMSDTPDIVVHGLTPTSALMMALEAAEERGVPGIDLGMENVYEHPWKYDARISFRVWFSMSHKTGKLLREALPNSRYPEDMYEDTNNLVALWRKEMERHDDYLLEVLRRHLSLDELFTAAQREPRLASSLIRAALREVR